MLLNDFNLHKWFKCFFKSFKCFEVNFEWPQTLHMRKKPINRFQPAKLAKKNLTFCEKKTCWVVGEKSNLHLFFIFSYFFTIAAIQ